MKTLFLLHGFGTNSRVWEPSAYELSSRYEVLIPDLPGYGETIVPFEGIRKAAETLANMIKEAKLPKLNVVGWSMGGQIAIELYDIMPAKFESLVLLSSTPKFTSKDFEQGYNISAFKKFSRAIKQDHIKAMDEFYRLMFSERENAEEHLNFLKDQMPQNETLVAGMSALESEDQRNKLAQISVPTLILTGTEDKICEGGASRFMASKISSSTLKVFGGAGHALQLTGKKEFVNAVKEFIG
jgi:pimeloyl-[acyl-carrier protein] methyl ester esterase